MSRIVETSTLPPVVAAKFFMPWLLVSRGGYVAGVSSHAAAARLKRLLGSRW